MQRQFILGGVLLQTNFHTSSESAEEYSKIEFQNSVSALSPILGSTADTYPGVCLRILKSILVQFQDMHVAIQTAMSLLYSRHNTDIVMYPSDGAHKNSETSLLASLGEFLFDAVGCRLCLPGFSSGLYLCHYPTRSPDARPDVRGNPARLVFGHKHFHLLSTHQVPSAPQVPARICAQRLFVYHTDRHAHCEAATGVNDSVVTVKLSMYGFQQQMPMIRQVQSQSRSPSSVR